MQHLEPRSYYQCYYYHRPGKHQVDWDSSFTNLSLLCMSFLGPTPPFDHPPGSRLPVWPRHHTDSCTCSSDPPYTELDNRQGTESPLRAKAVSYSSLFSMPHSGPGLEWEPRGGLLRE